MSGDFVVDEHGTVILPKLGAKQTDSVPADALREQITAEYQRYLRNPSINISFLCRIKVIGAVARPGIYPVELTTTVTDAIAVAGGVGPAGRSDRLELVRGGQRRQISLNQTSALFATQVRSGDEIVVPQRSWISRNPTMLPVMLTAVVSLIGILAR